MIKVNGIKLFAHATALAAGLALSAADAASLFITPGGTSAPAPASNDFLDEGVLGFIDAYLGIDFGGANQVQVSFEYGGSEASFSNAIRTGETAGQPGMLANYFSDPGDMVSYMHPLGVLDNLVDFYFTTGTRPGTVVADNIHPFDNSLKPNDANNGMGYWLSQAGLAANQAYIGLDDGGGGSDGDYDDLVVLVTVNGITEVPVPATVALMGLGILGLGLRRKMHA